MKKYTTGDVSILLYGRILSLRRQSVAQFQRIFRKLHGLHAWRSRKHFVLGKICEFAQFHYVYKHVGCPDIQSRQRFLVC